MTEEATNPVQALLDYLAEQASDESEFTVLGVLDDIIDAHRNDTPKKQLPTEFHRRVYTFVNSLDVGSPAAVRGVLMVAIGGIQRILYAPDEAEKDSEQEA